MNKIWSIIFILLLTFCVEPYNFKIINNYPTLVVEAQISNMSFSEYAAIPSDGRYFSVSLRKTNDVSNVIDQVESGATVTLESSKNEEWQYLENPEKSGTYLLYDEQFKAKRGNEYQLKILLASGESYESAWETLPASQTESIGSISFQEVKRPTYVYIAGEEKIRDELGMDIYMDLPSINSNPVYYKWSFEATWIYVAPFTSTNQDINQCWVKNKNYLSNYALQVDNVGGYPQKLTYMATENNDRIYKDFSLLISQYSMSEKYYQFWKELQDQSQNGGLFDAPPFNLQTNFRSTNTDKKVTGYFGVVNEQATRWNFHKDELSYRVDDRTKELCSISYGPDGPGGPECYDCSVYPFGTADTMEPSWWADR